MLAPAHGWLQRRVDRRLYGDRRDPRTLLEHLADELAAVAPEDVATTVAARTAAGLRLPWVAVELDREGCWEVVGASGTPAAGPTARVDITHAGDLVGRLVTHPRRGQATVSPRDLRALSKVALMSAPALSAARLVDELTQSRERLVTGREQERARLRRELHDGLSPSLAGMSLALNAARQRLGELPDDIDQLLGNVQHEAVQASMSVRALLGGLRPPGLEELGLVGALEDRARQLTRPQDFEITVAADSLPPLPSAVEIAAYRIAIEAMANAARHSGGHHCDVSLSMNGRLQVSVTDDGLGFDDTPPGIGLGSMRERARELGGELVIDDTTHGTVVRALLPT